MFSIAVGIEYFWKWNIAILRRNTF